MKIWLAVIVVFALLISYQAAQWGHQTSHWLWCTMARLCQ